MTASVLPPPAEPPPAELPPPPRREPGRSAAALAAATPDTRDRYLDLLRVGSIAVVVLGHWLMLTITVSEGRVRAGNVLAAVPAAQALTWVFQVMQVFFL